MFTSKKLFRALLKIGSRHRNVAISVIFSISVLWWTHPDNTLLYGQDSYNFFLNVFNPILNPFHIYNIEQGWITNISIASAYPILSLSSLLGLVGSPPLIERLILMLLIFIQTFGLLRLLETFDKVRGSLRKNTMAALISSLFYLANVFTLTVTLWHYELWTFPLAVAPYWLSSILEILYSEKVSRNRLLQTIGISIFLSPAMSGGWAVMWIFLIIMAFIFLLFFLLSKKWSIRETFSRSWLLIALGASTLLWINIPSYLIFFILHPVSATSVSNYESLFLGTAGIDPIYKVLAGLNLSQWPIFDVQSYGWVHGYWNILLYTSYLIIPVFLFGLFFIRRNRALLFFYVISIPVIIFSNGNSFPFSHVNNYLFDLGGSFLILANAYYFIGALYIISIAVIIYQIVEWSLGSLQKYTRNRISHQNQINEKGNIIGVSKPDRNIAKK